MRKSFFDLSVSLEEDTATIVDEAVANGGDEPVEATDVVEAEQETADLVESQKVAEDQVATLEDAEVVADDLEDQLEEQEQILEEKPEEVTEDTVAVAQESIAISLTKLGMKYEDIMARRISFEANGSTPLQKFQVCTEDLKDVLTKIKDNIIATVRTIVNQLKKLWQNASIFFDRSAKTADKLIAEYKSVTGNVSADDAIVKKVNAKFGGWFLVEGKYDFAKILKFAEEVKIPKGIAGDKSLVSKFFSLFKFSNAPKITSLLPDVKEGEVVYLMGNKVTYATPDDLITAEVDTSKLDSGKCQSALNSMSVSGILVYLQAAKKAAEAMKKFQTDTFAAMDSIIKDLNTQVKNAKEGEGEDVKKRLALTRKIGTRFALQTVNQYIGAVNGSVNCCAMLLKTTKKSEK